MTVPSHAPNSVDLEAPILVVDDDPRIRQVIQWALEDEGLPVELASDGLQALEKAAHRRPALVVLDWMLPGLDGGGVAEWLRGAYGGTLPILVITADGRASERAALAGAFAYLRKPFDIDDLVAAIRRGLQSV